MCYTQKHLVPSDKLREKEKEMSEKSKALLAKFQFGLKLNDRC